MCQPFAARTHGGRLCAVPLRGGICFQVCVAMKSDMDFLGADRRGLLVMTSPRGPQLATIPNLENRLDFSVPSSLGLESLDSTW